MKTQKTKNSLAFDATFIVFMLIMIPTLFSLTLDAIIKEQDYRIKMNKKWTAEESDKLVADSIIYKWEGK